MRYKYFQNIKYIFNLFFIFNFISHSCCANLFENPIIKDTLQVKEIDEGYLIYLDDVNIIKLFNYSTNETYLILQDKNKVKLDFYIIPPYLTGAYVLNLDEFGKVLALESYSVGTSGLSANIINVSLIFLNIHNNNNKVLSYNSFCGGIELLFKDGNKFLLNIYDYNGIDKNNNIIYCLNIFELTKDCFKRTDSLPKCYIDTEDKQLKFYDRCNCSTLYKPYVLFN